MCKHKFEDLLKTYREDNPKCPKCCGETERLLSFALIDIEGLFISTPSQKADKESRGARLV